MRIKATFLPGVLVGFILGATQVVFIFHPLPSSSPSTLEDFFSKEEEYVFSKEQENTSSDAVLSLSNDKWEPCQTKFLLLTSQKSGSTWFSSVLHQQSGISAGGRPGGEHMKTAFPELLIDYSLEDELKHKHKNVTWTKYKNDLEHAFSEVCEYNPALSIGFTLMYNQIPSQFYKDNRLQTYFEDNGVHLVHLVREAKILNVASYHNAYERKSHHTTNSSEIAETSALEWNEKVIDEMLNLEKTSLDWQDRIHRMTPHVPNYYVSYENLLVEEKRKPIVAQIVSFLLGSYDHPDIKVVDGTLLKRSNSSCSARIANYTEFRAHKKVINSRSAAACDMIDMMI